jgi:hypothetical protein
MGAVPIIIKARQINDDELRTILIDAHASGQISDFFERFAYRGPPDQTLALGRALLKKCKSLEPAIYETLLKGTPFYWLADAAFQVADYETAAFYVDAAVSEDIRFDQTDMARPALLFFLIDSNVPAQAMQEKVGVLERIVQEAIDYYNSRTDAHQNRLGLDDIRGDFIKRAISPGNGHLRTLVTAFISFFLEWDHRRGLIDVKLEQGTVEPFFTHLFKGCLLFESLLKSQTKTLLQGQRLTLKNVLKQLRGDLGFSTKDPFDISADDFQAIVSDLSSDDGSVFSSVNRTGKMRNTTGHNLGWQVSLNAGAYDRLASSAATSCLHVLACLYR